ncbi:MAG: UDP-N-acetylglucosamine--N-acetylmuramyl-(pentapeptide) pyrophosphoryl-undecaprenol N-acetylglucosamine transferase [bacterium]
MIALAGGGTAGHITPLVAVWEAIKRIDPTLEGLFCGSKGGMEEKFAQKLGLPFYGVKVQGIKRSFNIRNIAAIFQALNGARIMKKAFTEQPIKVLFTSGGYAAFPALWASRWSNIPYLIHESNAYPGLVTRIFASHAKYLFVGYTRASKSLKLKVSPILYTGNPSFYHPLTENPQEARKSLRIDPDYPLLLVIGGSQGSLTFNQLIKEAWTKILDQGWSIIWQTGKKWHSEFSPAEANRSRLWCVSFLEPPEIFLAFQSATVALTRCGAMTMADLSAAGLPAIMVPYPYASEGHQSINAQAIKEAGGGIIIPESQLTVPKLLETLEQFKSGTIREQMVQAMKSLYNPSCAETIAHKIYEIIQC